MMTSITNTFSDKVLQNEANQFNVLGKLTSRWRTTPSIFIIGAQKAGTTSLYQFLIENDIVAASEQKEMYFFNNRNNYDKGIGWYLSHFPLFSSKPTCDASANYFESDEAPKRIYKHFPEAKIILLLRNPAKRAFSHYQMAVKLGFEKLSFEEALKQEDERLAYGRELASKNKHNYLYQRLGYRTKGIYIEQLKHWTTVFPKEQIHIVQSEELFSKPDEVCEEIMRFLDVTPEITTPLKQSNKGSRENIPDDIKMQLKDFYAPYNKELCALINKDFNWE